MNTRILLAIAGAAALSACTKTNKAEIVALPAIPVESPKPAVAKPSAPSRSSQNPGFRLPDPTEDLYPLRQTATTSHAREPRLDPPSIMPSTPPPKPAGPTPPVVGARLSPEPIAAPSE